MHELAHTLVKVASSQLVTLLALDVGLALKPGNLLPELRNPVLWRILVIALLAVPMLAILVAALLPMGPIGRGVLVLMAVSPGAPLMIQKTRSQGRLTLAVAVAVALTLAALVTLPIELFVLNRLFPLHLRAPVPELLRTIVPRLLIPLVVGALVRRWWPKGADALAPLVRVLFYAALALVAIAAFAASWQVMGRVTPWGWLGMLLVTLGAIALGDFVGGGDPRERTTAAYAVVLGNPAVAISVASFSYPSLKVAPVILAYVVLRAVLILPYAFVSRRRLARTSG